MGVVLMSKRELNRIDVLARLDGRRLTASAAADLMRVTLRQTHPLLKRYRDGGAPAIANRRRGRPSNNRLSDVVRDHAISLVRETGMLGVTARLGRVAGCRTRYPRRSASLVHFGFGAGRPSGSVVSRYPGKL
jgi:hypothetical protein